MTDVSGPGPLAGTTIGITADRRWREQAALFERRGAVVVHGPSMRTVELVGDPALRLATEVVVAEPPGIVVATTGGGFRLWLQTAEAWGLAPQLRTSLAGACIVARGAKAASVVRGAGFDVAWKAPSERMDEVVAHLVDGGTMAGARVAVQLFDPTADAAVAPLRAAGATVIEVPVYHWQLPDDPGPARRLVDAVVAGGIDALTFTSQPAVHNLFRLAERDGLADALRNRCNDGTVLVACIGAVCAEAAVEEGLVASQWPDPPRLAALARLVTDALAPSA